MKRCPTCNRSYIDDTQKFCLDDGATLLDENARSYDPQATLVLPGATSTTPPSNPYGSASGHGSSGSGAGQPAYGSGGGQGSFGSDSSQYQQAGAWSPSQQRFTPVSTPAPKRRVLPWVLGGAAVVVVGLIALIVFVAMAVNWKSPKSTTVVIRSSDGKVQVSVPPTWKSTTELNDQAELQVSDTLNELYLIVLTDTKADYTDMDLNRHAVATLDTLTKEMTSSDRVGPTKLTIDGYPAVQYEVRGEIKNLNVIYVHTTVETASHYQQIVAWTLQSRYVEQKSILDDTIASFKEN